MKVSNPKLLHKQTKNTLVRLIIELRKKFEDLTDRLHRTNLKLATTRVELEDMRKTCTTIKQGTAIKTRSLKNTIRRRRKVSHV